MSSPVLNAHTGALKTMICREILQLAMVLHGTYFMLNSFALSYYIRDPQSVALQLLQNCNSYHAHLPAWGTVFMQQKDMLWTFI